MTEWIRRGLTRVAGVSVSYPRLTLLAAAILTGLAAWSMTRLQLSADVLELIPTNVPAAAKLRLLASKGSIEPVILTISGQGENDLEDRIDLALALRDRLAALPLVRTVRGTFGPDPAAWLEEPIGDFLLLHLPSETLDALPGALSDDAIDQRIENNRARLLSPMGALDEWSIREDPLGLVAPSLKRIDDLRGSLRLGASDSALVTEDGAYVLLLVCPLGSPGDIEFSSSLLTQITGEIRRTLSDLGVQGTVGVGPPQRGSSEIHVGMTGRSAIVVDYRNILARDIRRVSTIALLAVLGLFLIGFRRLAGLIIAGVPLLVGIIWTLGVAALLLGRINVLTVGSVPILCGLSIDFTIHLYNRYIEESLVGRDLVEATAVAHGETGIGVLAAAGTTTWAFLSLGVAIQPALRDLALICGVGVPLALLASLTLVPALIAVSDTAGSGAGRPRPVAGFGLRPVISTAIRWPRVVVFLGVLVTTILGYSATNMRLDDRLQEPSKAPSKRLMEDLAQRTGTLLEMTTVVVRGRSGDEVLDFASRIARELDPLVRSQEGPLAAAIGPSDVLPSNSQQRAALARLREIRGGSVDPQHVEHQLLTAMDRHGFRVDEHARRVASRVTRLLSLDRTLSYAEARRGPLGPLLEDLVLEDKDGTYLGVVSVFPRPGITTNALITTLEAAIDNAGVPGDLVGARVLSHALKPLVYRDARLSALIASSGVVLILLLTFRRVSLVLVTFLPVVVGAVCAIGLMEISSVGFDPACVSMIPVIFGIGVDDGIHIVYRFIGRSGETLMEDISETGRGVVLTSLTTMVGFGALMFAEFRGLFASGVLIIFGVGATLVTAVTLVPALLHLLGAGIPGVPRRRDA